MLTQDDLTSTLNTTDYVNRFRALCRLGVTSAVATYVLMERYAHINGFAGSGVALLAGNIGYERELFAALSSGSNPDRGMRIAAKVFSATIDEHGGMEGHAPHRSMAQGCLEKVAQYAGLSQANRVPLDVKQPAFLEIVRQFKRNYAASDRTPECLVYSLGYHVASEYLADREYQILDEEVYFKNPDPRFREIVRRTRSPEGQWGGVWSWITVHGHYGEAENDDGHGVEAEHCEAALEALRLVETFPPLGLPHGHARYYAELGLVTFRDNFLAVMNAIAEDINVLARESAAAALKSAAMSESPVPTLGEPVAA